MKNFKLSPEIVLFDRCQEFCKEFNIGEKDLIITNEYIYKPYFESYVKNATVAYTSLGVGFVSVLLSIISLSVGWKWFYLIHIALWVLFLVGLSLFVVFNTRKTLTYRAGGYIEPSEFVALKDKIEYYNM